MTNETRDKLQEVANCYELAILNYDFTYALGIEKCYTVLFGISHEKFIEDIRKLTDLPL